MNAAVADFYAAGMHAMKTIFISRVCFRLRSETTKNETLIEQKNKKMCEIKAWKIVFYGND